MCYVKNLSIFAVAEKKSKSFCLHQKTIAGAFFFFFVLVSETYV